MSRRAFVLDTSAVILWFRWNALCDDIGRNAAGVRFPRLQVAAVSVEAAARRDASFPSLARLEFLVGHAMTETRRFRESFGLLDHPIVTPEEMAWLERQVMDLRDLGWKPDATDAILCAQAAFRGAVLLTADQRFHSVASILRANGADLLPIFLSCEDEARTAADASRQRLVARARRRGSDGKPP